MTENIRALRQLGIGVKLNASMTPYNVADMEAIYGMARELEIPMQLATYMFPPIRRDEALVGCNDRFTACQAADYSVQWDRLRLEPEQFQQRAQAMKQGMALPSEDEDCQGTPGEGGHVPRRAQRLLDQLAGRDDSLRHDDPADFLRAGNGLCPGLGGDQSGHREDPPAGGVRRLPLEGGMPRLRRHVRDGDRPLRREAGVCLPDDP